MGTALPLHSSGFFNGTGAATWNQLSLHGAAENALHPSSQAFPPLSGTRREREGKARNSKRSQRATAPWRSGGNLS
jgi:hypothetical protein